MTFAPTFIVVVACRKNSDPRVGLAFVPNVIRGLQIRYGLTMHEARMSVIRAAKRGKIELRPESGLNRLSAAEKFMCVVGADDTLLSWARVTGES